MASYTVKGWQKSAGFADLGFLPVGRTSSGTGSVIPAINEWRFGGNFVTIDGINPVWDPSTIPDFATGIGFSINDINGEEIATILYEDTSGCLQIRIYTIRTGVLSAATQVVDATHTQACLAYAFSAGDTEAGMAIMYAVAKVIHCDDYHSTSSDVHLDSQSTYIPTTTAAVTPVITRQDGKFQHATTVYVYAGDDGAGDDGTKEHALRVSDGVTRWAGVKNAARIYQNAFELEYNDSSGSVQAMDAITAATAWYNITAAGTVTGSATYRFIGSTKTTPLLVGSGSVIFATRPVADDHLIIYYGELAADNSITWTALFQHSTATLVGMSVYGDATSIYMVIEVDDGGTHYLYSYTDLNIRLDRCAIHKAIQQLPSKAYLHGDDLTPIQQNMGVQKIYDSAGTERFRGYLLPTSDQYSAELEGVDRALLNPVNASYAAHSGHDLFDHIAPEGLLTVGTNNLAAAQTYVQSWGQAMPKWQALSTIVAFEAALWRTNVATIDAYLLSALHASGVTITFGTSSVECLSKRPSVTRPINRLTVIGAVGDAGIMQKTLSDTVDIAANGINALIIRRADLQQAEAVIQYCTELWTRRQVVAALPKVFTLKYYYYTWIDVGDTIEIVNGTLGDDELTDGTYIVLSNHVDLVTGESILELSTSIAAAQDTFTDILPEVAQVPVIAADNAAGTSVSQSSIAELLGGLIPLRNDAGTLIASIETVYSGGADHIATSEAIGTAMVANFMPLSFGAAEGLGDHVAVGSKFTATAGENLAIGDFVYFKSDTKLWKAKADAIATAQCIGVVCVAANTDSEATVLTYGFIRDDSFAAMTVGGTIYLSTATAGAEQNTTVPSANNHCVCILGVAVAAYILHVKPNSMIIELIA